MLSILVRLPPLAPKFVYPYLFIFAYFRDPSAVYIPLIPYFIELEDEFRDSRGG